VNTELTVQTRNNQRSVHRTNTKKRYNDYTRWGFV